MTEVLLPPSAIKRKFYRCDKRFHLDHLESLYEETIPSGLVLLSGDTIKCYLKNKDSLILKTKYEIQRQKAHSKGGQSAQRFNRIQQSQVEGFIKESSELVNKTFWDYDKGKSKIEMLIVASNSGLGERLILEKFRRRDISVASFDIDQALLSRIDILVNENDSSLDKKIYDEITELISISSDLLVYGQEIYDYSLKKLYCIEKVDTGKKIGCTELVRHGSLSYQLLSQYGGAIGVKWYLE